MSLARTAGYKDNNWDRGSQQLGTRPEYTYLVEMDRPLGASGKPLAGTVCL